MICRWLFCLASFGLISVAANAGESGGIIGTGMLSIGMKPVELNSVSSLARGGDAATDLIAQNVQELLPSYIQRGFEKGLDRRVSITQISQSSDGLPSAYQAIVSPTVTNLGKLGVRVSVKLDARAATADQVTSEQNLLISPDANFGDIDDKLSEFGLRLSKALTELSTTSIPPQKAGLPRGIVGFYCVQSADPVDLRLQELARMLTLELPYQLSKASQKAGLDLVVRGLEIKEVLYNCDPYRNLASNRPTQTGPSGDRYENFVWFGTLVAGKLPGTSQLTIRASDRLDDPNFRPVSQVTINNLESPEVSTIAEGIVSNFVACYRTR
jgi:hypothetical protein